MLLCLLQTRMARSRFVHTCGKGRYKNRLKINYQNHIRSKQRCDEYFSDFLTMSNKIDCAKLEEMFGHFDINLHRFSLLVNIWFNSHLETKYVLSLLLTYYENTTASPRGEIIRVYFCIQLVTNIIINVTI